MNNKSLINKKLVVQPVFTNLLHINAFMGPCRYGSGEELTYEFDLKQANKTLAQFEKDNAERIDPRYVELLPTKRFEWHEDFAIKEENMGPVLENKDQVDAYLISGTRLISYVSSIIAKRTNKPILFCPLSNSKYSRLGGIDASAHLDSLGYTEYYNALDYAELNQMFRLLKVRKAMAKTKIMFGLRNNVLSFGAVSSFRDLGDITKRFGTQILNFNGMEVFKVLDELTPEQCAKAEEIAAELVAGANGVHMPAENVVNDVKFYMAANEVLDRYDCNAFTIPCFEMCATMELNRRQLTFCLTHSLFKDEGIPSACAGDVGAVVATAILMNLTRKAPHMGNCMVNVKDREHNSMRILHDVASRCMKGYDEEPLPVDLVSFTKGNWGTTMRYDFAKDAGDTITMINLSPAMDKMMIATGTVTGCDDFLTQECRHAITFTVKDSRDFHRKEAMFGHHFEWVYGDYSEDLKELCRMYGIEAVMA